MRSASASLPVLCIAIPCSKRDCRVGSAVCCRISPVSDIASLVACLVIDYRKAAICCSTPFWKPGQRTALTQQTSMSAAQNSGSFNQYKIAVLVPCYNEEMAIAKVVKDFRAALPTAAIFVFDNNSTDNTAA